MRKSGKRVVGRAEKQQNQAYRNEQVRRLLRKVPQRPSLVSDTDNESGKPRKRSESLDELKKENRNFTYFISFSNLQQNDLRVRDEEYKQAEKMGDMERQKNSTLISQLDELTSINTQLTMQFSDAKRKLISLELVSYFLSFHLNPRSTPN